jgi:DNA repair photolyase
MTERFRNILTLTSQFPFCGMPLRLDSYRGCSFQCTYCFARWRGGAERSERVVAADPGALERVFRWTFQRDPTSSGIVGQFLWHRVPVHFGGMSDPFQMAERRWGVTKAYLRTLAEYEYPTVISTKSAMVAEPEFLDLLVTMKHVVVQFSFCSTRDAVSLRFDGSASPPSDLLRAMEVLISRGVTVTVRWQPFIAGISESANEFVGRVVRAGARHVGIEHLKVAIEKKERSRSRLAKALGTDAVCFYLSREAQRDGREYVLGANRKIGQVLATRGACRDAGISFGAADNDLQHLSTTDCCCSGVDQFDGFKNFFRHQVGWAVRTCSDGYVRYESMASEWAPIGSIDRFLNSRSRLRGRTHLEGSLRDHLSYRWNDPKSHISPASFEGVVPTDTYSDGGYRVYWRKHDIARIQTEDCHGLGPAEPGREAP